MLENGPFKERVSTCSKDCYGACVFKSIWKDDAPIEKLVKTIPLKDHPFTQGVFCPKFNKRERLVYHSNRLKHPYILRGSKGDRSHTQIPFSDAWNFLKEKSLSTLKKHGANSIMVASYSGNQSLISCNSPRRFFRAIGAHESSGGICNEGGIAGLQNIFGDYSITNPFQILNPATKLIVIWKSDLVNNNNHMYLWVKKAQKKGVKVILLDDRRLSLSKSVDKYIKIPLNSEHSIIPYILNKITQFQAHDLEFLEKNVLDYQRILMEIKKSKIDQVIKNNAELQQSLDDLVQLLIEHKHHTLFLAGYGVNKDFFGGRQIQLLALLQIFLGNIGIPGTGLIYSQSSFQQDQLKPLMEYITDSDTFPEQNMFDIINLAKVIEKHSIKMLFIYNFNPANSLPNQNHLRKVLSRDDLFIVLCDVFPNETMNYANLVFPMKIDVETWDLTKSYYLPGLSLTEAGPCPYPDCRSNHEFFNDLAVELGESLEWAPDILQKFVKSESDLVWNGLQRLDNSLIINEIKKQGYSLFSSQNDVWFSDFQFPTSSGKIELSSLTLNRPQTPVLSFFEPIIDNEEICWEFNLITPNHPRFLHSQLGDINEKHIKDFKRIFVSDPDLVKMGLKRGEKVKVYNKFGSSRYILDSLLSLSTGIALIYSGGPDRMSRDGNANSFTSSIPEEMGHSGAYNSSKIRITRLD